LKKDLSSQFTQSTWYNVRQKNRIVLIQRRWHHLEECFI